MNLRGLITLIIAFTLGFSVFCGDAGASLRKKSRPMHTFSGRVAHLKHGRDRKRKHFWEYQIKTSNGKIVTVHDYKYGRYRQPASVGLQNGAKTKVRGFFVHLSSSPGASKKHDVLVVPGQ